MRYQCEREKVKKATEQAVAGRTRAVVNRRIRQKISPEALKKFSDTLTKTFREKVLANRKLYVVKYMLFSTENRSGAKKNSFINDGRRYYPIVVPNTVRTGNVKAQKFIESMVKVKVDRFSDRARFKRMMAIMRTDKSFEELMEGEFYHYVDLLGLRVLS